MTLNSSKVFSSVLAFIIIASLVSFAFAQPQVERLVIRGEVAPAPQRAEKEEKAAKEIEKKALALLNEVVAEAMSLRRADNRIYVLIVASDLMWDRDEGRARALAREAMDQTVACMREVKKGRAQEVERDSRYAKINKIEIPRLAVAQLLAYRDARLALEFLQETRQLLPEEKDGDKRIDNFSSSLTKVEERKLELNAAYRIAPRDPQTAMWIAEKYLDDKLDDQFVKLWGVLLGKDPMASAKLTERIINDLKSHNLNDRDESQLVYSVLGVLRSLAGENAVAPETANETRLDSAEAQQAYRDALEIVVDAALKVTPEQLEDSYEGPQARRLLEEVQKSMPDIEKHLPSQATAVGAKLAQFAELFRRQQSPQEDRIENPRHSDSEEILDAIEQTKMEKAMKDGRLEEVRRNVSRLKRSEERSLAWIELARKAEADKNQKLRREALSEAREVLVDRMETHSQVGAQLELAVASLDLDPDLSFEILGSAIDRLNMVLDATMSIAKFTQRQLGPEGVTVSGDGEYDEAQELSLRWDRRIRVRVSGDGEYDEAPIGEVDFAEVTIALDKSSLAFAQEDFDRTLAALKRLQIDVVRLRTCLMLMDRILNAESPDNVSRHSWFPDR